MKPINIAKRTFRISYLKLFWIPAFAGMTDLYFTRTPYA